MSGAGGVGGVWRRAAAIRAAIVARITDLGSRTRPGPDGLPLPPARLMRLVSGAASAEWFLAGGRGARDDLEAVLARCGRDRASLARALDFGCGCGRVLRHLRDWTPATELHGCDLRRPLARWTARHIPFARVVRNRARPPLPYAGGSFDLVWALSVFTHLPADLERVWLDELRRVLAPGGLLVLTLHGEANAAALPPDLAAAFARGERVVAGAAAAGSNACNAFHPEAVVRAEVARGFLLVEHLKAASRGNPPQDVVLLAHPEPR